MMPSGVWLSGFAAFEIRSVSNWNEIVASPVAVADNGTPCMSRAVTIFQALLFREFQGRVLRNVEYRSGWNPL